jgi:hypothetical protein
MRIFRKIGTCYVPKLHNDQLYNFKIYAPRRILGWWSDEINSDEMGKPYSTHIKFCLENLKRRDHVGELGEDKRTTLKYVLKNGALAVDCNQLVQDRVQWRTLGNTVTDHRIPLKAGNLFNNFRTLLLELVIRIGTSAANCAYTSTVQNCCFEGSQPMDKPSRIVSNAVAICFGTFNRLTTVHEIRWQHTAKIRERIQKFPDWVDNEITTTTTTTTTNTRWETTQRAMVAKLTKLTHKIAI